MTTIRMSTYLTVVKKVNKNEEFQKISKMGYSRREDTGLRDLDLTLHNLPTAMTSMQSWTHQNEKSIYSLKVSHLLKRQVCLLFFVLSRSRLSWEILYSHRKMDALINQCVKKHMVFVQNHSKITWIVDRFSRRCIMIARTFFREVCSVRRSSCWTRCHMRILAIASICIKRWTLK